MKPINAYKDLSVHLKCSYVFVGFYLHCEKKWSCPSGAQWRSKSRELTHTLNV